jgi:hypothetical protein
MCCFKKIEELAPGGQIPYYVLAKEKRKENNAIHPR